MKDKKAEDYLEKKFKVTGERQIAILIGIIKDLIYEAYLDGRYQGKDDIKAQIKLLKHDINYNNFKKEEILLAIEDILAC